jgi:hypothetical protein
MPSDQRSRNTQSSERTDGSIESSEYEKDRVAWNLPTPRRPVSPSLTKPLASEGDDDSTPAAEVAAA